MKYRTETVTSLAQIINKLGLTKAFKTIFDRTVEEYEHEYGGKSKEELVIGVLNDLGVNFKNYRVLPNGQLTVEIATDEKAVLKPKYKKALGIDLD